MTTFQNILCPTDYSRCAEQAFAWAAQLAVDDDVRLHVLHVDFLFGGSRADASSERRAPDASPALLGTEARSDDTVHDHRMRAFLASQPIQPPHVEAVTRRAFATAPSILDYADEHDIDLIVTGTQGRRGLGYLALGSVAEEIVRRAECPVLTVRELEEAGSLETIETILVPIDGSEHSDAALALARELAARFDASLQLLHVVETPVYPSFYALEADSFRALLGNVHGDAKDRLRQAMNETDGPRVPYEPFVVEGVPSAAILDFSERHRSSLVVLPTHGLTSLRRFFLGSVAEKVVRRCKVPVITLPVFEGRPHL